MYVAELAPGIGDEEVLAIAQDQSRLLLTCDKDFGELVYRQQKATSGVLLLRLAGVDASTSSVLVAEALSLHEQSLLWAFSVLTEDTLRIRPRTGRA